MDVDKILPFSSTLGWHSLNVNGEVQTRKGLRWIPRHPETRKGVVSDEMLRGVENKHRSGDSRIGQPFELLLNPWAGKRQPGELKHLSSQRKRKQKRVQKPYRRSVSNFRRTNTVFLISLLRWVCKQSERLYCSFD